MIPDSNSVFDQDKPASNPPAAFGTSIQDQPVSTQLIAVCMLNLIPYFGLGLFLPFGPKALRFIWIFWLFEAVMHNHLSPWLTFMMFSVIGCIGVLARSLPSVNNLPQSPSRFAEWENKAVLHFDTVKPSDFDASGNPSADDDELEYGDTSGFDKQANAAARKKKEVKPTTVNISKDGTRVSFGENTDLSTALPSFAAKMRQAEKQLAEEARDDANQTLSNERKTPLTGSFGMVKIRRTDEGKRKEVVDENLPAVPSSEMETYHPPNVGHAVKRMAETASGAPDSPSPAAPSVPAPAADSSYSFATPTSNVSDTPTGSSDAFAVPTANDGASLTGSNADFTVPTLNDAASLADFAPVDMPPPAVAGDLGGHSTGLGDLGAYGLNLGVIPSNDAAALSTAPPSDVKRCPKCHADLQGQMAFCLSCLTPL